VFIAYIDASGTPPMRDPENYVLAAVIISEDQWQVIDNLVRALKINHFPNLPIDDIELHAKDMVLRQGIFRNLLSEGVYKILDDVFTLIGNDTTSLKIISVVMNKPAIRSQIDIQEWAYTLFFERLNLFLIRRNRELVEQGFSNQFGIMIMDTEGLTKDQRLRGKLVTLLRQGTHFSNLQFLIEDPLFTDSKWRNLSQIADCIAYCVRKEHRNNNIQNTSTANWHRYFTQIIPKFDAVNGQYKGFGLKIFPES
jgi:hypothetical protein